MLDLLRRHVALLAAVFLGWLLYSDLNPDEGRKTAEAKVERLEIPSRFLEIRPADRAPLEVVDPFRFTSAVAVRGEAARGADGAPAGSHATGNGAHGTAGWEPAGAQGASDWSPSDVAAAWVGALRVLSRDVGAALGLGATTGSPGTHGAASMETAAVHPFTLVLESTLDLPQGGLARISGFQVAEGESLPALDPDKPPRLLDVNGTTVLVAHGNVTYTLDLHSNPRIDVGQPAGVAPAGPAARTDAPRGAATDAGRPATPAAPRASAPPAPGAPKPAGTYKVRKKPGKKP